MDRRAVGEEAANLGRQRGMVRCNSRFGVEGMPRVPNVCTLAWGTQPFNGRVHCTCTQTCLYLWCVHTFFKFFKLATVRMVAIR